MSLCRRVAAERLSSESRRRPVPGLANCGFEQSVSFRRRDERGAREPILRLSLRIWANCKIHHDYIGLPFN